ncbi:MAG: allantoinase AllB [Chloroflexota bacterium]
MIGQTAPTTLIRGGTLVLPEHVVAGDLVLRDGHIAAILEPDSGFASIDAVVDARGLLVLPGGIDPHAHAEEPGAVERADFASVSRAAAAGGVSTIVEMPLSIPPTTTLALLREKIAIIARSCVVDVGLYGGLQPGSLGALEALHYGGVLGFKAFMVSSEPSYLPLGDGLLFEALRRVAMLPSREPSAAGKGGDLPGGSPPPPGGLVLVHAESETLVAAGVARLQAARRYDALAHPQSRPPLCEVEAIERALLLARAAHCRLHVVHTSTREGVQRVAAAHRAGQPASCEVCPHHLLLDEEEYARIGPWAKCTPPIRTRAEVEGLWAHLLAGRVTCLSSDHSAATVEEKEAGLRDVWAAPNGIQSLDVGYPLVFSEGVWQRGLSLTRFAALTATNAARLLGLAPRKGAILPGADADLALYDPHVEWTVDASTSFNRQPWSPYHLRRCRGRVVRTLVRGLTVYLDGQIMAPGGWGRFVAGAGAD